MKRIAITFCGQFLQLIWVKWNKSWQAISKKNHRSQETNEWYLRDECQLRFFTESYSIIGSSFTFNYLKRGNQKYCNSKNILSWISLDTYLLTMFDVLKMVKFYVTCLL